MDERRQKRLTVICGVTKNDLASVSHTLVTLVLNESLPHGVQTVRNLLHTPPDALLQSGGNRPSWSYWGRVDPGRGNTDALPTPRSSQ